MEQNMETNIISRSGAWMDFGDIRLGQGKETAKQFLRENPKIAKEIEKKILATAKI